MLINEFQIISNLRRTAEKGLISLLNPYQLEELALKYFGIYEGDELVGYMCPYSGEVYNDFNEIVLEHIIPVSGHGGTTIFNCIPTSEEVNKKNEKGIKHLIDWWPNSKYWDKDAPKRLEKIVNYILEGYDIYINEEIYDLVKRACNEDELISFGETMRISKVVSHGIFKFRAAGIVCFHTMDVAGKEMNMIDISRLSEWGSMYDKCPRISHKFQLFRLLH